MLGTVREPRFPYGSRLAYDSELQGTQLNSGEHVALLCRERSDRSVQEGEPRCTRFFPCGFPYGSRAGVCQGRAVPGVPALAGSPRLTLN
jgi:hypothetical protein